MKKYKVAVIKGGKSAEREISLKTGSQIAAALRKRGHEVQEMDISPQLLSDLLAGDYDIVFLALHGRYGEDGTIQGMLDLYDIPYTGSGVLASALSIDKAMTKRVLASAELPVPPGVEVSRDEFEENPDQIIADLLGRLGLPAVVKPNREGSTVGLSLVEEEDGLRGALETAFHHDDLVLLERYIKGIELTVPVIGNRNPEAMPIIEIVPKNRYYDYESKYAPGGSEHIIPARIPEPVAKKIQEMAIKAYKTLGCRVYSRIDFIYDPETNCPYILENNTLPGMTETSLVPDAARYLGIEFGELLERIISLSLEHR
ncbi:MAG: D-alanine--D-alanine ligase [Firmicutes bacterium]|nr:D-alanine--D-alanine ligase [Bacillota bacterium]